MNKDSILKRLIEIGEQTFETPQDRKAEIYKLTQDAIKVLEEPSPRVLAVTFKGATGIQADEGVEVLHLNYDILGLAEIAGVQEFVEDHNGTQCIVKSHTPGLLHDFEEYFEHFDKAIADEAHAKFQGKLMDALVDAGAKPITLGAGAEQTTSDPRRRIAEQILDKGLTVNGISAVAIFTADRNGFYLWNKGEMVGPGPWQRSNAIEQLMSLLPYEAGIADEQHNQREFEVVYAYSDDPCGVDMAKAGEYEDEYGFGTNPPRVIWGDSLEQVTTEVEACLNQGLKVVSITEVGGTGSES